MCELASGPNLQRDFPGKDRKKAKVKKPATAALPKPRTIKFHEYKVCVVNIFNSVLRSRKCFFRLQLRGAANPAPALASDTFYLIP
jgi:hypothetical protein